LLNEGNLLEALPKTIIYKILNSPCHAISARGFLFSPVAAGRDIPLRIEIDRTLFQLDGWVSPPEVDDPIVNSNGEKMVLPGD